MKNVTAHVYNPQNPVEAAFQDEYHQLSGRWLSMMELHTVVRCIPTYRGLARRVHANPDRTAKLLFGETNTSNVWYYPCDVIELRAILGSGHLSWHAPIMLFSPKVARRLMPEYPVCLVFDRTVAKDGLTLGGIHVRQSNRLDMDNALKRIMIRDYMSEEDVNKIYAIVKQTAGYIPAYLLTALPGVEMDMRKAASTEQPADQLDNKQGNIMGNWFTRFVQSAGPADTFGKEFLVGKQPRIPDPEEMKTEYKFPHKALSLKQGDRVAYRYTDVKLPVNNDSMSLPFTRSLVQTPRMGTVKLIDHEHIHVLWDGSDKPQMIPLDQDMFLIKAED